MASSLQDAKRPVALPLNKGKGKIMKMKIKVEKPKTRVVWGFKPTTRIVQSKKVYNRKKLKRAKLDY